MPVAWAITIAALWVAVIALAIIVLGLLRQLSAVLEQAVNAQGGFNPAKQGPSLGSELPHFVARTPDGEFVSEEQLRGNPSLLLFLSGGCAPCHVLAQEMSVTDLGVLAEQLIIVTSPDARGMLGLPPNLRVLTESANEVSDALSIRGWPFAVAVDLSGIVRASRVPNTVKHLEDLAAVLV